jgi:predicted nucleic acid-binding protein
MDVTLVDTNVVLDLVTDDPKWADWSIAQMDAASLRGALAINDVVCAELSVRFATIEGLDAFLANSRMDILPIPRSALFLAGKAFQRYRAQGGVRTGVLPDFFIGAHAAIVDFPLVTRDPQRFRTYFPKISLITP